MTKTLRWADGSTTTVGLLPAVPKGATHRLYLGGTVRFGRLIQYGEPGAGAGAGIAPKFRVWNKAKSMWQKTTHRTDNADPIMIHRELEALA